MAKAIILDNINIMLLVINKVMYFNERGQLFLNQLLFVIYKFKGLKQFIDSGL
jgi:hypothetical protein